MMAREERGQRSGKLLRQRRAAFNIGEEKGDGASR
jgi:hypothetical protein